MISNTSRVRRSAEKQNLEFWMLLFKILTKLTNLWKFRLVIDNVAVDDKLIENHFSIKLQTRPSGFFFVFHCLSFSIVNLINS